MAWSAPIDRTRSTFVALDTPVTSAPNDLAICTAKVPIPPPAPMINTFCPGLIPATSRRPCRAVTPESGTAAACSNVRFAGFRGTASLGVVPRWSPLSRQAPDVEHAARGVGIRVPLRERDLPVDHDRGIPVPAPAGEVRELHPGVRPVHAQTAPRGVHKEEGVGDHRSGPGVAIRPDRLQLAVGQPPCR